MDDLIPCEFCQESVSFVEYESHINQHINQQQQVHEIDRHDNVNLQQQVNGIVIRDDDGLVGLHFDANMLNRIQAEQTHPTLSQLVFTLIAYETPEFVDMNDYEFNTLLAERIGVVEVGVTDINRVILNVTEEERNQLKESVCAICQESFDSISEEIDISKTTCNHIYCQPCISRWLAINKKCPVCMIDLEELKIE